MAVAQTNEVLFPSREHLHPIGHQDNLLPLTVSKNVYVTFKYANVFWNAKIVVDMPGNSGIFFGLLIFNHIIKSGASRMVISVYFRQRLIGQARLGDLLICMVSYLLWI